MRRLAAAFLLALTLVACSSPRACIRMRNVGSQPVRDVELDYGVMFGAGELKPGEMKQRYVPIPGPADLEIRFYDAGNQLHRSTGPHIQPGESGEIEARIGDNGKVTWAVTLKN